ncbi:MAG TPA: hypothetical protein VIW73_06885, partial [Candidatus Cybelea sp.]
MITLAAVVLALGVSLAAAGSGNGAPAPTVVKWNLSAQEVRTSCPASIASARNALDALAKSRKPPSLTDTLLPLENL